MKLFISWSGDRSKNIAKIMKEWIESIFPSGIKIWLSTQSESIRPGALLTPQIIEGLRTSEIGIFCFTTDNTNSLWMMFEAGAICKQDTSNVEGIYTILFEGTVEDLERTPLKSFYHTLFERESMYSLLKDVNNKMGQAAIDAQLLKRNSENIWSIYYPKIMEALCDRSLRGGTMNKKQLMEKLRESEFGRPRMGQVTFYEKGFEDYPLYEILLKNAEKRLWIFGRKNRKCFDSRNTDFLKEIKAKPNFDFKCLFLDPEAPADVLSSAQDTLEFPTKLKLCIKDAYSKLKLVGMNPNEVIRLYASVREYAVIVVDDAVLFSPILYKKTTLETGHSKKPEHLTRSAFNLVSINEEIANYHIDKFLEAWEKAEMIENSKILQH